MLVTVKLLVLVTVEVLVLLLVTVAFELGPVLVIVPEPLLAPPAAMFAEDAELFTVAAAAKLLLAEAAPVEAPPALVLPLALAVPVCEFWVFPLVAPRVFVLFTLACHVSLLVTVAVELGPVVPMLPELAPTTLPIPAMRLSDVIATPAIFTIFFISPPFGID